MSHQHSMNKNRELYSSTLSADGFTSEDDNLFIRLSETRELYSNSSPYDPNEGTETSSPLTSSSNSDDGSFEQVINKRPRLESQEYLPLEVQNHSDEHAPVLNERFGDSTDLDIQSNSQDLTPEPEICEQNDHFIDFPTSEASSSSAIIPSSSEKSASISDDESSFPLMDNPAALPAFAGSSATRSSFEATFLALSKKHKFSKSTRHDLLKFVNIITPSPNLPSSNYSFDQDVWRATDLNYDKYEFCPSCDHLLCLNARTCENDQCKYFNVVPEVPSTELFFIIPVAAQLRRILEDNWLLICKYKSDHRHDEGLYRDICCGQLYRQHDGCDDPTQLLSLIFHTDGAPAVKSKTLSLWPIQCILVELPPAVRYSFKNVLFCGLWCGTKKPNLQMFHNILSIKSKLSTHQDSI